MTSHREAHIHYIVAFVGGFLGLFPIVNAAHVFGSAQTMNGIDIVMLLLGGSISSALLHLGGAALYAAAIILVTVLQRRQAIDVRLLALAVDALTALCMWRFPVSSNLPLVLYLYPTFFSMAFQWTAFKGAYNFNSSTIFSSNNFKQFFSSLTEVYLNGDKSFSLKAHFFGLTLLAFHTGIAASYSCWHFFGNSGFLFTLLPLSFAALLIAKK